MVCQSFLRASGISLLQRFTSPPPPMWVRLNPIGTAATLRPIVPALDDRWWWMCSSQWNENWQGKPKYSEKSTPVPLCPPKIPYDMTRARTRAAEVGNRRLTAWARARPRSRRWFNILFVYILQGVCDVNIRVCSVTVKLQHYLHSTLSSPHTCYVIVSSSWSTMPWRDTGEWRHSSTILDLVLDGSEWSASHPDRFTPGVLDPLYSFGKET
jgi:hypothetical protein